MRHGVAIGNRENGRHIPPRDISERHLLQGRHPSRRHRLHACRTRHRCGMAHTTMSRTNTPQAPMHRGTRAVEEPFAKDRVATPGRGKLAGTLQQTAASNVLAHAGELMPRVAGEELVRTGAFQDDANAVGRRRMIGVRLGEQRDAR